MSDSNPIMLVIFMSIQVMLLLIVLLSHDMLTYQSMRHSIEESGIKTVAIHVDILNKKGEVEGTYYKGIQLEKIDEMLSKHFKEKPSLDVNKLIKYNNKEMMEITIDNKDIIVSTLDEEEMSETKLFNIMNRDFAIYAKAEEARQAEELKNKEEDQREVNKFLTIVFSATAVVLFIGFVILMISIAIKHKLKVSGLEARKLNLSNTELYD